MQSILPIINVFGSEGASPQSTGLHSGGNEFQLPFGKLRNKPFPFKHWNLTHAKSESLKNYIAILAYFSWAYFCCLL